MTRQWAPGDVATTGPGSLVVFYKNDEDSELMFVNAHGYRHPARTVSNAARPLVVIDPEDREQVERLAEAYRSANSNVARMPSTIADRLTNALREFADPKPPKPAEPLGLGAVVEDADGKRYVRSARYRGEPWDCVGEATGGFPYSGIHAVRVLSEGVTP